MKIKMANKMMKEHSIIQWIPPPPSTVRSSIKADVVPSNVADQRREMNLR
jgi:hypothetical protein